MPVAEANRERTWRRMSGGGPGGMEQFVGSLFMVLGVLVHIEAFAKRSQMTSKSGKSLFTPQTAMASRKSGKERGEGRLEAGLD